MSVVNIKYTGTAPGADANTYVLFSTAPPSAGVAGHVAVVNWGPMSGIHTFHLSVKHSQSCTFKGYRSLDGGTTWIQFYDSGVVTAPTYTTEIYQSVEGFRDFKFEVLNAGVAQATWNVHMDCSVFP
jgi:hypothetical protein